VKEKEDLGGIFGSTTKALNLPKGDENGGVTITSDHGVNSERSALENTAVPRP